MRKLIFFQLSLVLCFPVLSRSCLSSEFFRRVSAFDFADPSASQYLQLSASRALDALLPRTCMRPGKSKWKRGREIGIGRSMWDVKWVSVDTSRWIDPGCTLGELSSTKSLAYAGINTRLFAGDVRPLSSFSTRARRSNRIPIDLLHSAIFFSSPPPPPAPSGGDSRIPFSPSIID